MSRIPRLVRSIHSTATRLIEPLSSEATSSAAVVAPITTTTAPLVPSFTPKGRPIPTRPPRTTRVTLASGFPEPPTYPPPSSYFDELKRIEESSGTPNPHPLWSFFHTPIAARSKIPDGSALPPDGGSVERVDVEVSEIDSGRSWTAAELRQKSFQDLHTLWYVLLRERNVLATQREERRRLGIPGQYGGEFLTKRAFRCRKSMARIKYILNERRLAIIAAAAPEADPAAHIPFSSLDIDDPAAAVDALRGAPAPNMAELLGLIDHEVPLEANVEDPVAVAEDAITDTASAVKKD